MPKLERHPFASGHEIEPPVAIVVDPERGGNHAEGLRQLGRELARDIREPATVVAQEVAAGWRRIIPWHEPAAHEQIRAPVAVEVSRRDAGGARQHLRQRLRVADKFPTALVDIETVLQQTRRRSVLITAAGHVEIGPAVAIGVEEHRAPVLIGLVRGPRLSYGRLDEAAVFLEKELARHAGRPADKDVVE